MGYEYWNIKGKRTRVFTVRKNGKLQSWIKQTDANKRGYSLKGLKSAYGEKGSFNKQIISRTVFAKGVVQTVSEKRYKKQAVTQVAMEIRVRKRKGSKGRTFTGYSNKGKSDFDGIKQARGRAYKVAIDSGYIDYTDIEDMTVQITERVFYIAFT